MCGISGELRFDGRNAEVLAIKTMTDLLERRGPDACGEFFDGPLGFGHRRLSIIDLSDRSRQPMVDNDLGLVVVFNGTIYNYKVLRKELRAKGYSFFSEGDTEVIIKAYHAWGERCVERLHGMFAFSVWDKAKKQMFVARDRFGIKPLYFSTDDHRFRFASTTQALLKAGGIDTSIDPVALHNLFTLHAVVPAPRTILNGIRKVKPATYLIVHESGQVDEHTYWQLDARRPAQPRSEQEWKEAIRDALRNAVKKRKDIADVPVGVLLSGGLDSSLLVALLAEAGVEDIRTFSIGFEDIGEEKGSEFEFSDQVVERYQTTHHKLHVSNSDVLPRLPEAIDNMTEPMFGQDAVAFYLLSEQVSQHVKVVQSGQGADEVFGGYFWYPKMNEESGSDLERFSRNYFDRDHSEFRQMVTEAYRGEDYTGDYIGQRLAEPNADEFLDKVLRLDSTTLIVDDPVKRVDNMTMSWGLEARVPFLDHELVELAAQMPTNLKLKSGGKHILKEISRGIIPDGVIDRPKGYFPMPALKYVRGEFFDFMQDTLNSQACISRNIYDRDYVARLLAEPEGHFTRIQGSKVWHLALLEQWLQRNVDTVKV